MSILTGKAIEERLVQLGEIACNERDALLAARQLGEWLGEAQEHCEKCSIAHGYGDFVPGPNARRWLEGK